MERLSIVPKAGKGVRHTVKEGHQCSPGPLPHGLRARELADHCYLPLGQPPSTLAVRGHHLGNLKNTDARVPPPESLD